MIYLIGSLRNPKIPELGVWLREQGFAVFDDWFSPGPEADDYWKKYEQARGRTYLEALKGWAGTHVYEFDKYHLSRADQVVLAMPAGRSGHLELGWALGQGKPGFVLLEKEEPERWDVMLQFATGVFGNKEDLAKELKAWKP
jgi:nucleoside 2-deoxyribosyltransferase